MIDNAAVLYEIAHYVAIAGVFIAILTILTRSLISQDRANTGLSLENNFVPILLTAFICVLTVLNKTIESQTVIIANTIALLVVVIIGSMLAIPPKTDSSSHDQMHTESDQTVFTYKNLGTFWWIGMLQVLFTNLPFLILPVISNTHQIGLFGAAHRFVATAATILSALTSIYAPRFAVHFASKKYNLLARGLRNSQVISLVTYLPFIILFIVFGETLLGYMGSEFKDAKLLLWIMSIGQLVNAATGLSGILLNMIHQERYVLITNVINLLIMFILVSGLGYIYGIIGVAVAYSIGISIKFILLYIQARQSLNSLVNPTPEHV